MKITGIETYPVWAGERNLLFVTVDTDEGFYGVGAAGLTGRELAVVGAIEHFEPLLLGERTRSVPSTSGPHAPRDARLPPTLSRGRAFAALLPKGLHILPGGTG